MKKKEFWSNLSWFLNEQRYESIEDFMIPSDIPTFLLYNTNDLCLNEEQFNALMESIGSTEKFYIVQNDSEEIYEFDLQMSYKPSAHGEVSVRFASRRQRRREAKPQGFCFIFAKRMLH